VSVVHRSPAYSSVGGGHESDGRASRRSQGSGVDTAVPPKQRPYDSHGRPCGCTANGRY